MPMINFTTHATVRCAVCRTLLLAEWDDVVYTMNVQPCHDCMDNAKRNALEDMAIARAEFHRDEKREEHRR